MSDDRDQKWIDDTLARLQRGERQLAPYRAAVSEVMKEIEEKGTPASVRYANFQMVDAIREFLTNEMRTGATEREIVDGLRSGGRAWNSHNFEKEVGLSLTKSVKTGIFVRDGERYLVGKKVPAHHRDRHKK
jgi:hypothetical protein